MCKKESRVVDADLERPHLFTLFFKEKIKSHTCWIKGSVHSQHSVSTKSIKVEMEMLKFQPLQSV